MNTTIGDGLIAIAFALAISAIGFVCLLWHKADLDQNPKVPKCATSQALEHQPYPDGPLICVQLPR